MKITKKTRRFLVVLFFISFIAFVSNYVVRETSVCTFSIFEPTSLFTYFGVLIGFALTIYTFGLSMVSDIKSKIDHNTEIKAENKKELYELLVSSFGEIKGDIWLIFYSILVVIICAISDEITNPFGWDVEDWKIPQTFYLTLFISTTIAMWDIMQTLFHLAEINLELNK